MDFDIHQLDRLDSDSEQSEAALETYREALLNRFAESPEGQNRLQSDPDMGFWSAQLMYYGYQYEGTTLPRMTVANVHTIVSEWFPRKISVHSTEQAEDAIPELLAFWKYLKREFELPQADDVLELLREMQPDFPGMMTDPSNFGIAKSFFAMGQTAGFDMTTQEGMHAFMLAYNTGQLARQAPLPLSKPIPPAFGTLRRLDPAARKAEKKKRKQAAEARKRNRKRGK